MWTVLGETLWELTQPEPLLKDVEVLAGSWIHLIQFRRPIMGAVENLWSVTLGDVSADDRAGAFRDDMLRLIALVPLAGSSWSLPVDEVVSASDASETGGGVCVSTSLTGLGRQRLQ